VNVHGALALCHVQERALQINRKPPREGDSHTIDCATNNADLIELTELGCARNLDFGDVAKTLANATGFQATW